MFKTSFFHKQQPEEVMSHGYVVMCLLLSTNIFNYVHDNAYNC